MSGWVYVVTNKSIKALVKVGYTTRRDLNHRLREFNQAGLPYPYEKAYALWVEEPRLIEQRVHQALAGHRENKEWFRCSVEHAKETIEQIAGPESVKAMAIRAAEEEQLRMPAIEAAKRKHQRWMEEAQSMAERAETEAQLLAQREVEKARRLLRQEVTQAIATDGEVPLEEIERRGYRKIRNDRGPSADLAPKPGWKLLEEIEGKPCREIWRQSAYRPDRGPFPWGFWIPVGLFAMSPLFSMC